MNIHEHQAKELFKEYNIPVSNGSVAFSRKEIEQSVKEALEDPHRLLMDV